MKKIIALAIAAAMVFVAKNREKARSMGETGYRRLMRRYQLCDMRSAYAGLYRSMGEELGLKWQESESN